jgi:hypothetical protein
MNAKNIGREGWIAIGMALLVILAAIATTNLVGNRPATLPALNVPAAVPASRFSGLPQGYRDYMGLNTVHARPNYSAMPPGFSDYQALLPKARINHSALPAGLTDYANLHTIAPAQPRFSAVPRGFSDYQNLHTTQPSRRFSPLPRGYTDHLSPSK